VQNLSFAPPRPLADFIERFWFFSDSPLHRRERIVPSGTIELVFNLDEDEIQIYDAKRPARCRQFSGAVFSGAYGGPFVIDTKAHASIVGVHFKPGGAFPFLGVPASELADAHVDLETLWGTLARELRDRLCAAATPTDRFRVLENTLNARLKDASTGHRAVHAALDIWRPDVSEMTTIRALAAYLGFSQRHFIHVFSNEVGMTPKLFCRVQRFQRTLELARKTAAPDWAGFAAACGYFDQSHMIHEFKAFSGLSPSEYRRQRSERVLTNHVPLTA
jgi:AraC-like DNA-binding protein